jgi:hypothetical protein
MKNNANLNRSFNSGHLMRSQAYFYSDVGTYILKEIVQHRASCEAAGVLIPLWFYFVNRMLKIKRTRPKLEIFIHETCSITMGCILRWYIPPHSGLIHVFFAGWKWLPRFFYNLMNDHGIFSENFPPPHNAPQ